MLCSEASNEDVETIGSCGATGGDGSGVGLTEELDMGQAEREDPKANNGSGAMTCRAQEERS